MTTDTTITIFAVTLKKKIILVENLQESNDLPLYQLPSGPLKEKSPDHNSITILEEKINYTSDNIFFVDEYQPTLEQRSPRILLFLALDCTYLGNGSSEKTREVTLEEYEQLLNQGALKDANTRIGYYRYLEYLMKEGY